MEGMDKIKDTLISIVCWIIGGFLLLLSLTIFGSVSKSSDERKIKNH